MATSSHSDKKNIIVRHPPKSFSNALTTSQFTNGEKPDLSKTEAFIISPGIGINYKPGTWHFPLISTENMNFLVIDRKGLGDNLVIENLDKENITLKY